VAASASLSTIYVGVIEHIWRLDEYQMRVLDISNKNNHPVVIHFSPSSWQTQEGKALNYSEDVLSLVEPSEICHFNTKLHFLIKFTAERCTFN
jgi:hypothetical protein